MNTMFGGNAPDTDNFYVAMLDGNLNIVGEIYYHNEERMVVPYSIHVLESGDCLVSTAGKDRKTLEMQHAIFRVPKETFDGIDEAHDAGFAMAVAYPNPGKGVLNIRTGLKDARVEVYDLSGRLMHRQDITENVTGIDAGGWAAGSYVWKVYTGVSTGSTTLVETGKWIKE